MELDISKKSDSIENELSDVFYAIESQIKKDLLGQKSNSAILENISRLELIIDNYAKALATQPIEVIQLGTVFLIAKGIVIQLLNEPDPGCFIVNTICKLRDACI